MIAEERFFPYQLGRADPIKIGDPPPGRKRPLQGGAAAGLRGPARAAAASDPRSAAVIGRDSP